MDKNLKIASVVLIFVGGLQVSREVHDLGREDSRLNLRGTRVRPNTGNFLEMIGRRLFLHTGGLGRQNCVGAVSTKLLNTLLDDQTETIFGVSVVQIHYTLDSLLCIMMLLPMQIRNLLLRLRVCGITVRVLKWLGQVLGELKGSTQFIGLEIIV